jgi:small subunit ribosomal protein S4
MLELRLDNLVYRFGLAPSRKAARQFVTHGHMEVNGRKASIPSMILKEGDVIRFVAATTAGSTPGQFVETAESRGIVPQWLALDKAQSRRPVLRIPTREELAPVVNEQLIVELYSK